MRRVLILLVLVAMMMFLTVPAMAQVVEEQPEVVFSLAWVGGVIAFFLPFLTSFLKRDEWDTQLKKMVALAVAAIAGVVNVGVQAGWKFDGIGDFFGLVVFSIINVYVAAAVIYKELWEDTPIESALSNVKVLPARRAV